MISNNLQILSLQPRISKVSQSPNQFFLKEGQNNFGNKIPFLFAIYCSTHNSIKSSLSKNGWDFQHFLARTSNAIELLTQRIRQLLFTSSSLGKKISWSGKFYWRIFKVQRMNNVWKRPIKMHKNVLCWSIPVQSHRNRWYRGKGAIPLPPRF